jgi:hypothetical protein
LIDEVRAIRKAISDSFGNDVDRLCDHLKQIEQQHPHRIVGREGVRAGRGPSQSQMGRDMG